MATPNVAGGVALLWSARPCYRRQQDLTESLLNGAAVRLTSIKESCGGNYTTGPNNTWGNGRMDVYAAVQAGVTSCVPPETAPGTLAITAQNWTGKTVMSWPANVQATSYNIYRGLLADLPHLLDGAPGPCARALVAGTNVSLSESPAGLPGGFYWYLVTGSNSTGEGPAGSATAGVRIVNPSGACP